MTCQGVEKLPIIALSVRPELVEGLSEMVFNGFDPSTLRPFDRLRVSGEFKLRVSGEFRLRSAVLFLALPV